MQRDVFERRARMARHDLVIGTRAARPLAVSSVHTSKSRSKTIVRPSYEIVGHSTRPSLNCVTCRSAPPIVIVQMFCVPVRSDT